ncbi:MAG: hypothetical protein M3Q07_12335 [Pseudobdellovibrionaceae bacterium]|nr:hypothetical protein [Pseudobdellovibrionaceae bacterium]
MKKHVVFSVFVLVGFSVGCSTVHVTRVHPGRGGELAVQEGIFGEPAHVKAERVMQGQCPEGYVIEEEADVKVGSTTVSQSESQGKVSRKKVASSTTTVSETQDKTERRITWKCRNAAAEVAPVSSRAETLKAATATTAPATSPAAKAAVDTTTKDTSVPAATSAADTSTAPLISVRQPTGWNTDISLGRRWYKPQDHTFANFHSTNVDFRFLYELHPSLQIGGSMHVDGYDNDTDAADEDFSASLFELGVSAKIGHSFGALRPYVVGNYYMLGGGTREYERTSGFVTETYSGRISSHGLDGALGLALQLGEGSVYFEWYRSAERNMAIKGTLERQVLFPSGAVQTTKEGEKHDFKTRYDGFALGVSFPIKS